MPKTALPKASEQVEEPNLEIKHLAPKHPSLQYIYFSFGKSLREALLSKTEVITYRSKVYKCLLTKLKNVCK